ncbi:hypothetical protein PR048_016479 [Dryococelus australis]|uniref:Uncharacterized protein n=1 Tax=Dryococelus australis TaxID=614101 RepID=A0ABQ9HJU3_9NEOP|nr:hypothetical protein PR048_016479 [Dryococelus australis]
MTEFPSRYVVAEVVPNIDAFTCLEFIKKVILRYDPRQNERNPGSNCLPESVCYTGHSAMDDIPNPRRNLLETSDGYAPL